MAGGAIAEYRAKIIPVLFRRWYNPIQIITIFKVALGPSWMEALGPPWMDIPTILLQPGADNESGRCRGYIVSTASDRREQLGINVVVQYEVVVPPLPMHAAIGGGLVAVASEENGYGSLSAEVDGGDCVVENRFYHGGNFFAILPV
ncbi:hypothetical protein GOBAR_AA33550 [Gossypium barbadense]|uniref:Uncharacterized protein n=1 Tax=Gossypium barbadense TaxID=3634 RepID=A0A2P5W7T0_GOSBA|nr:hypothetical protein GOBAR_AA33550 [Gossypium barbadense]